MDMPNSMWDISLTSGHIERGKSCFRLTSEGEYVPFPFRSQCFGERGKSCFRLTSANIDSENGEGGRGDPSLGGYGSNLWSHLLSH